MKFNDTEDELIPCSSSLVPNIAKAISEAQCQAEDNRFIPMYA